MRYETFTGRVWVSTLLSFEVAGMLTQADPADHSMKQGWFAPVDGHTFAVGDCPHLRTDDGPHDLEITAVGPGMVEFQVTG
jgi:hypothetical protein